MNSISIIDAVVSNEMNGYKTLIEYKSIGFPVIYHLANSTIADSINEMDIGTILSLVVGSLELTDNDDNVQKLNVIKYEVSKNKIYVNSSFDDEIVLNEIFNK